jgi:hypothetical protein
VTVVQVLAPSTAPESSSRSAHAVAVLQSVGQMSCVYLSVRKNVLPVDVQVLPTDLSVMVVGERNHIFTYNLGRIAVCGSKPCNSSDIMAKGVELVSTHTENLA